MRVFHVDVTLALYVLHREFIEAALNISNAAFFSVL
jgi:hypothetical protein